MRDDLHPVIDGHLIRRSDNSPVYEPVLMDRIASETDEHLAEVQQAQSRERRTALYRDMKIERLFERRQFHVGGSSVFAKDMCGHDVLAAAQAERKVNNPLPHLG